MQFFHDRLLSLHHCFGGRHFGLESTCVQSGQDLSACNLGPFLNKYLRNTFAVVEGEIDLTQINVSVQHQTVLVLIVSSEPPESEPSRDSDQDQKSDNEECLVPIEEGPGWGSGDRSNPRIRRDQRRRGVRC